MANKWHINNLDKSFRSLTKKLEKKADRVLGNFNRGDLAKELKEKWVDIVQRTTWVKPTPAPRSTIYLDEAQGIEGKVIQYGWSDWPPFSKDRLIPRAAIMRKEVRPIIKAWVRNAIKQAMR
jgi:hypothetical protein